MLIRYVIRRIWVLIALSLLMLLTFSGSVYSIVNIIVNTIKSNLATLGLSDLTITVIVVTLFLIASISLYVDLCMKSVNKNDKRREEAEVEV